MNYAYPGQPPAGPVYQVRLTKVSSFIVFTQRQVRVYRGTLPQLENTAHGVLTHNLALGWWGFPFGLIWTPIALSANASAMRRVRALAAQQAPGYLPQQNPPGYPPQQNPPG